ncbi:MAG: Drug resistance transporter EmrB/QacA subfamily [Rhodocyclaceae bacterium]|nr:MAG: Drug resistance transporter EmrB/QacA subfamily [Rhodocyclaceae bacterium]TND05176.1 MAG: Drug resistance transporter EmrB/QacA subfamily [Rhodocyclaceae bacterium]
MSAETEARQQEVAGMFDRHGPGYRWWAVLTVMLGTVSAIMEATVVNVALPEIIRAFHLGHDQVQLLSTGFLAATTASMLLATWAMQRFGIRRTFVGALLLLVMFSVLAALSDRFELLALCRIGQGSIAGLIQPLAMLVIIDVFPIHERGRAMGAYGLGIVLSPAVGPVLGGLLVDHYGWRAVFLVTVPLCLAAIALAPRFVIAGRPLPGAHKRPFDPIGLVLVVAALCALLGGLAALIRAPALGSAAIALGIGLAVAFVVWERSTLHPLLDLSIFREAGFGAAVLVAAAYGVGIYGSTYLAPIFAQIGAGFSAYEAGVMLVPGGIVLAIVLLLSGRLADRFPPNRVAMAGLAFFAVSAILMGFSSRATGFWMLALWVAIGRIGLGLIIPGLNAGALRLLPHGTEAAGSASINFFRQLGGALGVTLLALFLEGRERHLDALHGLQPMQEGFFLIAFVYCLALIPAWMMTGRTQRPLSV